MLRRLSPRWLIPVTVVVLLLPACSDSADDSADTTLAPTTTTTTTATTTTAAEQVGTLKGFHVSFSLDALGQDSIDQVNFWGVVIIELEDGRTIDATVTNDLAAVLKLGDRVVVAPIAGSEVWEVTGLAPEE